jgi:pimeloyl-ACP methyl ester carboxylesterase
MTVSRPHAEFFAGHSELKPPSRLLLALETRAFAEFGSALLTVRALHRLVPRGDGHPVLVFPGLGASDGSTRFLRRFLSRLGYQTYSWGLGFNFGMRHYLPELMNERLKQIYDYHQRKVSLIGWSLGGIYAREVAKFAPDQVRQVITLGSPFTGHPRATRAAVMYELLTGEKADLDHHRHLRLHEKPPVPFTSIYSKSDGIVAWQCSIEEESPDAENIEVRGASHLGLGFNPAVLYAIAERLAQPEGIWKPFGVARLRRLFYANAKHRLPRGRRNDQARVGAP